MRFDSRADGMLQSLGAWLRLLGYDCVCLPGQRSRATLELAVAGDRVFLTRNARLRHSLPRALLARGEIVYVLAEDLPAQLREVVTRFTLNTEAFAFTRCLFCNAPLERTATAPAGIPAKVAAREREFWQCPVCGRTFWRGSHVHHSLARLHLWLQD